MSDELVDWLRGRKRADGFETVQEGGDGPCVIQTVYVPCEKSIAAADRITELQAEVEQLRGALDFTLAQFGAALDSTKREMFGIMDDFWKKYSKSLDKGRKALGIKID